MKDMEKETHEEEKEASEDGEGAREKADERKRGGHTKRKRGGGVHGEHEKHRPDRRARGGATSDLHPTTAAGKVSSPSYLGRD